MRSTFQDRRSLDSLPAVFMLILPALVISAVSRTHASHGCVKFTLSSGAFNLRMQALRPLQPTHRWYALPVLNSCAGRALSVRLYCRNPAAFDRRQDTQTTWSKS